MSTEFKWDDNNVMEFAIKWLNQSVDWAIKHDYAAAPSPIQIELQQFKASKQPKQDWEIISLKDTHYSTIITSENKLDIYSFDDYFVKYPEGRFVFNVFVGVKIFKISVSF